MIEQVAENTKSSISLNVYPDTPRISALRWASELPYRTLAEISRGTLRFPGARIGFPRLILFRGLFLSAAYFHFWPTHGFSSDPGGWPGPELSGSPESPEY